MMSDRIAVMRGGRIAGLDTPAACMSNHRRDLFATFLGDANILPAVVERVAGETALLACGALQLTALLRKPVSVGDRLIVAVRPRVSSWINGMETDQRRS